MNSSRLFRKGSLLINSQRYFRALLIGAPGAGKGTMAERLVSRYNMPHVCAGDVLRDHVRKKSEIGRSISKLLAEGQLVSDDVINNLMSKELLNYGRQFLLDGYPRTLGQAAMLDADHDLDAVLYLNVPFDVIINRLSKRWIHEASGRVYNDEFNPPKRAGVDDLTGEPLVQRKDDHPDVVHDRLKIYQEQTAPILDHYGSQDILKQFAGNTTDEIWPRVVKYLDDEHKLQVANTATA